MSTPMTENLAEDMYQILVEIGIRHSPAIDDDLWERLEEALSAVEEKTP